MSFDVAHAAAALERLRDARAVTLLPTDVAPRDEAEGVAVQRARAMLRRADPPAGFKIGATAAKMQDYLGLVGPIAGFMEAADLHASGVSVDWAALRGPGVECEIGVRLAADLPPGPCSQVQAEAAVGEVFAAIEIVENRYGPAPSGDLKAVGVPVLVADQVFHRAAVLGAPMADWRGIDLAGVSGRIAVDGVEQARGTGADLLGHPMRALAWLTNSATAHGFGGLRAGQVIMLGSVTPPIWLPGPCRVDIDFHGLGQVSVIFS